MKISVRINKKQFCIHRRSAIKMFSLSAVIVSAPFIITPSRATSKRIVIRDEGGIFSRIYAEVFYKPFTKATDIEIVSVTSPPNPVAQIRTMVETKRYLWDMAVIGQTTILPLTIDNDNNLFLEKHRLEHDPVISSITPQFLSPYGVGINGHAMVLAYNANAAKKGQILGWKNFWEIDYFPGRRSLPKFPLYTIEIALMADGVPLDKVYPCDLHRAFRSLDKIRPYITLWWTTGSQTEQLLKVKEVDFMPAFNVRAQAAIDAGVHIAFSWNQNIYGCNSWTILRGTPNADLCRQFIQFASAPKQQALLAPYGIGPTHPDAFKYIDPKRATSLPTYPDHLRNGLSGNASYWLKHRDVITERFNDWLIS